MALGDSTVDRERATFVEVGTKTAKQVKIVNTETEAVKTSEGQGDIELTLHSILKELKILNLHMSILTDMHIRRSEVE